MKMEDAQYRDLPLCLMVWFNVEGVPKSDIKSVIKSDIRFEISTKGTTWIGHKTTEKS